MKFKEYKDMINDYNRKELDYWLANYPELKHEKYIITEKIHGANFSVYIDNTGNVRYASKSQFCGNDFYNFQKALEEEAVAIFIQEMTKKCVDNKELNLTFYGELFGNRIQKEVFYGAKEKIRFYDIYDRDVGSFFTPWVSFDIFNEYGVSVPILAKDVSFEDAMVFNNTFISTLTPDDYKNKDTNICEGIVIKPQYEEYVDRNGKRFYVKSKNAKFTEKKSTPKVSKGTPYKAYSEEVRNYISILHSYITEIRFRNLEGKIGKMEYIQQMGEFIKAYLQDVIKDFENEQDLSKLSEADKRVVYSTLGKVIPVSIKDWFIKG